jgi:hypothetical protein
MRFMRILCVLCVLCGTVSFQVSRNRIALAKGVSACHYAFYAFYAWWVYCHGGAYTHILCGFSVPLGPTRIERIERIGQVEREKTNSSRFEALVVIFSLFFLLFLFSVACRRFLITRQVPEDGFLFFRSVLN